MNSISAALAGFLAGAITIALLLAPPAEVKAAAQRNEANTFVLRDGNGRKRGEWTVDRSGQPSLRMFDETGKVVWSTDVRLLPDR